MKYEDFVALERSQESDLFSALLAIITDIEAQAPVITDTGMVQVWIDVNRLRNARAAIQEAAQ